MHQDSRYMELGAQLQKLKVLYDLYISGVKFLMHKYLNNSTVMNYVF